MVALIQAIRRHTGMRVYGVVLETRRHMALRRTVAVETSGEQLGLLLQDPLSPIPDRARTCTVSRLLDVAWSRIFGPFLSTELGEMSPVFYSLQHLEALVSLPGVSEEWARNSTWRRWAASRSCRSSPHGKSWSWLRPTVPRRTPRAPAPWRPGWPGIGSSFATPLGFKSLVRQSRCTYLSIQER